MTDAEMVAEIERVLTDNARLLSEPQDTFMRRQRDGSVRIQAKENGRWVRGAYKAYPTLERAYQAAGIANQRAKDIESGKRQREDYL